MAELQFGGSEEENAELKKLNADVHEDPDSFEPWEKLVRAAESLEGGLNRNSSPQAIASTRSIYDRFLAKFPLFFGYWKKYADFEFSIAGTEAAELVYERGVASISTSVDLWAQYCTFKTETSHDPDVIRELFERGACSVGLDFLSHPFWDKYIEFEERLEAFDKIFAILGRVVHIPMHQYARYFERFRQLAASQSVNALAPSDRVAQFKAEIEMEGGAGTKSESHMEQEMRARIDNYHLEVFHKCQTETTKRWTYEQEVKRPYFHVTELDEAQLSNWKKYLDFEESEGDYARISFLYERCLVAAAYYDEFWLRYARWMLSQGNKIEETRNIYARASCIYCPIARPAVRLQWALLEEMNGRVDVAHGIYEGMLMVLPDQIEAVVAWAASARRHEGIDGAVAVFRNHLETAQIETPARAAILFEWAKMLWKIKGTSQEARDVFQQSQQQFAGSQEFWSSYLTFEIEQAVGVDEQAQTEHYQRIKGLFDSIRNSTQLSTEAIKELSQIYMGYLLERGGKDAAKEYMTMDRTINGYR